MLGTSRCLIGQRQLPYRCVAYRVVVGRFCFSPCRFSSLLLQNTKNILSVLDRHLQTSTIIVTGSRQPSSVGLQHFFVAINNLLFMRLLGSCSHVRPLCFSRF